MNLSGCLANDRYTETLNNDNGIKRVKVASSVADLMGHTLVYSGYSVVVAMIL